MYRLQNSKTYLIKPRLFSVPWAVYVCTYMHTRKLLVPHPCACGLYNPSIPTVPPNSIMLPAQRKGRAQGFQSEEAETVDRACSQHVEALLEVIEGLTETASFFAACMIHKGREEEAKSQSLNPPCRSSTSHQTRKYEGRIFLLSSHPDLGDVVFGTLNFFLFELSLMLLDIQSASKETSLGPVCHVFLTVRDPCGITHYNASCKQVKMTKTRKTNYARQQNNKVMFELRYM